MKLVISPAKSLDLTSEMPTNRFTKPQFLETSVIINKKLARFSKAELSKLMGISEKLSDLNYHRNQDFQAVHTEENSRPAMYMFAGDVYIGLDAYTIPLEKLDRAQNTLRILSGLYGIVRPLDLVQPYRLEMGTKLSVHRKKDLYELWRSKITDALNQELKENELFVNLASQEYFKAIDEERLKVPVVSPVFKDFKNGKLKIIAFHAKKARGAMARFIIDQNIEKKADLNSFDRDGYRFSESETAHENTPVFIR